MARYKVTKEQLERIVENFVMEAAIESKKAPVKDMIPSQAAAAKKHVKNKMSGNMVDQSEGMPSVTPMKKKLSQAADAKKHMSKATAKHTNKASIVKESELFTESISSTIDPFCEMLNLSTGTMDLDGDPVSKCFVALLTIIAGKSVAYILIKHKAKEALAMVKNFMAKFKKNKGEAKDEDVDSMSEEMTAQDLKQDPNFKSIQQGLMGLAKQAKSEGAM